jgi:hypothetical protein
MQIKKQLLKAGKKYLIVPNDDGTLGLEEYTEPTSEVSDVVYNGKSVVQDGVATIPTYPSLEDYFNKFAILSMFENYYNSKAIDAKLGQIVSMFDYFVPETQFKEFDAAVDQRFSEYATSRDLDSAVAQLVLSIGTVKINYLLKTDAAKLYLTPAVADKTYAPLQPFDQLSYSFGQLNNLVGTMKTTLDNINKSYATSVRVNNETFTAKNGQIAMPNYPTNYVKDITYQNQSLVKWPSAVAAIPALIDPYDRQLIFDAKKNTIQTGVFIRPANVNESFNMDASPIFADMTTLQHGAPDLVVGYGDPNYDFIEFKLPGFSFQTHGWTYDVYLQIGWPHMGDAFINLSIVNFRLQLTNEIPGVDYAIPQKVSPQEKK